MKAPIELVDAFDRRWQATLALHPVAASESERLRRVIWQSYIENGRHYHTITHLLRMFESLDSCVNPPQVWRYRLGRGGGWVGEGKRTRSRMQPLHSMC
jgi:hypothetical protein